MSRQFFNLDLGVVSRRKGESAEKLSAYAACERRVSVFGETFDFTRKKTEHQGTVMVLPDGAPEWTHDPAELWARAVRAERRADAQEARTMILSLPRELSPELSEACIRHVFAPLCEAGMCWQFDIHDVPARDGGRNRHCHGLGTLRQLTVEGFGAKERAWNDLFRSGGRKGMRALVAQRLTEFCKLHGVSYEADPRSNAERDLPAPEPAIPQWNFEAAKKGVTTRALIDLDTHRRRRAEWRRAKAEAIEADAEVRTARHQVLIHRPALASADPDVRAAGRRDRRAAVLAAWHTDRGWIDADEAKRIRKARIDHERNVLWLDLADGTTLVDTGESIQLKGRLTWSAALETAAGAERHGWKQCVVSGPKEYRDAVTVACLLRGIEVTNHTLSPRARARFEKLKAEQEAKRQAAAAPVSVQQGRSDSAKEWERVQALRRRAAQAEPEPPREPSQAPAYVPPWARKQKN